MNKSRFALFLVFVCCIPCGADIALRDDGSTLTGNLQFSSTGKVVFVTSKSTSIPLVDLREVRLADKSPPCRLGAARIVHLADGQRLTGEIRNLEGQTLQIRTAWSDRLTLNRDCVRRVTHLVGRRTVYYDSFAEKSDRALQGNPALRNGTLEIARPNQSLTWTSTGTLLSGRVAVTMLPEGKPGSNRWYLEVSFPGKTAEQSLRVELYGPAEHLGVTAKHLAGTLQKVAASKESARLSITFSGQFVQVLRDDEVLWHNLTTGPAGGLKQLRLYCDGPDKEPSGGVVAFSALTVEAVMPQMRRPPGESKLDELWLSSGDQVFGRVIQADSQKVTLQSSRSKRSYSWSELRGWYLKESSLPISLKAAHRVHLYSGSTSETDVLMGVLTALDAKQVKLRHAHLGLLEIPRTYVARIEAIAKE